MKEQLHNKHFNNILFFQSVYQYGKAILSYFNKIDHLKGYLLVGVTIFSTTIFSAQSNFSKTDGSQNQIPYLWEQGDATQLIVDGKPFLILGGELGNSSATNMAYMQPIWPKLKVMHLNTVLVPIFWELIEEVEGQFDLSLVDDLIREARRQELKLIFLWFGSWKNSMSSHAPAWVKTDQKRFPRAKDDTGRSQEILTPFSENNLQADLKAFQKLMQHLKDFDGSDNTVIMVQVENEIGMLPSCERRLFLPSERR